LFLPPGSLSPPPPHLLPHLTVIFRGAGFLFTWTTLQLLGICMRVCFVCVFVCVCCLCVYVHVCICVCVDVEWWSSVSEQGQHWTSLLSAALSCWRCRSCTFCCCFLSFFSRFETTGCSSRYSWGVEERSLSRSRHTQSGVSLWDLNAN